MASTDLTYSFVFNAMHCCANIWTMREYLTAQVRSSVVCNGPESMVEVAKWFTEEEVFCNSQGHHCPFCICQGTMTALQQ